MAIKSSRFGNVGKNIMINSTDAVNDIKIPSSTVPSAPSGTKKSKAEAAPKKQPEAKTKEPDKVISVQSINRRLKGLARDFGVDSPTYQIASDYIDSHINSKYLVRDDAGNVLRIMWNKEAQEDTNLYGRATAFDEYVPTKSKLLRDELKMQKKLIENDEVEDEGALELYHALASKEKVSNIIKDPKIEAYLMGKINETSQAILSDSDSTVEQLYDIENNEEDLENVDDLISRAKELISERTRTAAWTIAAKQLIREYQEREEDQRRKEAREQN